MDAYRNVVVVHGDGCGASPGEALYAVAATLAGPPGSYQRSDLLLGREVYARLVSGAPSLPELIEVGPGSSSAPGSVPGIWLRRLLGLVAGLPGVRLDGGDVDPMGCTRQAYRDLAETALLWSLWPVLLTMGHSVAAAAAQPTRVLLDVALLALLGLLVRSQWRASRRVAVTGCVWLGLCLVLSGLLWRAPQWRGLATTVSIRVYGLAQLTGALVLLGMAVETGLRLARRTVPWRQGLVGYALAVLPFGLASLLTACLLALVLNAGLAFGNGPVLEALKAWQQTFAQTLGYHLAAAEWGAAGVTVLVAVLAVAGGLHSRRAQCGKTARGWLLVGLAGVALGGVLVALCTLLSSRYLRAPLGSALRRVGPNSDVATIYTWSALRLVPWALLLLTPFRGPWRALAAACADLLPAGEAGVEARSTEGERLCRLLAFLDRGRHDRIHLLACGQGAATAIAALQGTERHHPVTLTTLGSPDVALYLRLLDRPVAVVPADVGWRNLYRRGDPVGGPVGDPSIDVPLDGVGHSGYWAEPAVADRIVQAMQAPV